MKDSSMSVLLPFCMGQLSLWLVSKDSLFIQVQLLTLARART